MNGSIAVTNAMVWAVVMGLVAAFVAYGRYALRPRAAARSGRLPVP